MNSCLYETRIMHSRLEPKKHRFAYGFFSFYLDLDEIDELARKIPGFSRNRWDLYSFHDRDHVDMGRGSVKHNILAFLGEHGIGLDGGRIMLLTYLRTFGYLFNPVSFFFCFDAEERPVCVVAEVGNTFGEMKLFLIRDGAFKDGRFRDRHDKYYYVSPFTKLDDQLDFRIAVPEEKMTVGVDTSRNGKKVLVASMTGERRELTGGNLLRLSLKFPWITLKVIVLIHWHALLLWIKKIPYELKTSNPHLQKEVHRVRRKHSRSA